ncbi:MAG: YraN family protein [Bacteroidetes bacterium]|nr:YraN family protein [Bacteroidota bacterium]
MRDKVSRRGNFNKREWGKAAENLAADFLEQRGLKILERNFRYERGEIDLIAEEGDELVFIEVKARRSSLFGAPEDAVTEKKQEQIQAVAEGYLFIHGIDDRPYRFDIVAIDFQDGNAKFLHMKDAF